MDASIDTLNEVEPSKFLPDMSETTQSLPDVAGKLNDVFKKNPSIIYGVASVVVLCCVYCVFAPPAQPTQKNGEKNEVQSVNCNSYFYFIVLLFLALGFLYYNGNIIVKHTGAA